MFMAPGSFALSRHHGRYVPCANHAAICCGCRDGHPLSGSSRRSPRGEADSDANDEEPSGRDDSTPTVLGDAYVTVRRYRNIPNAICGPYPPTSEQLRPRNTAASPAIAAGADVQVVQQMLDQADR